MITIESYKPTWPEEFRRLGVSIRSSMENLALRIDHIGSTAVPNLAAKDVIDIQVTVSELSAPVEQALNHAGYRRLAHIDRDHVPPGANPAEAQWMKWIFKPAEGSRPVNLHVRIAGRANQRYPILFRDYLRAHRAVALAYAETKIVLAKLHPDNVDAYYAVKDPVCDVIVGGAVAWAGLVGWRIKESDC